jgi:hypothetical protein
MKVIAQEIINLEDKMSKAGRPYKTTDFKGNDGKLYKDIYGEIKQGQEVEGEWKDEGYGMRFKITQPERSGGFKGGFKSDPNTMLVSYAKDVAVALIQSGGLKESKEIAKEILNFTQLFRNAYDKLSAGEKVATSVPKEQDKSMDEEKYSNEGQPKLENGDEEINLEDLPF